LDPPLGTFWIQSPPPTALSIDAKSGMSFQAETPALGEHGVLRVRRDGFLLLTIRPSGTQSSITLKLADHVMKKEA
jgi:hypothetical protein